MRPSGQHILFLATEFDAPGMRPYARTIINAMWRPGDSVLIVTRHGVDMQGLGNVDAQAVTWIDYPAGKVRRAAFRYRPSQVTRAIDGLTRRHGINLVYSLTGELILAGSIKRLQRHTPVLYTVHDAVSHDYKYTTLARWLKDKLIIEWPQRHLFRHARLMVTNSRAQADDMARRYPGRQVHYAPFPTLVSGAIAHGTAPVPELQDIDTSRGCILFFGMLHLYKGVHLLYNAYLDHPGLQDRPLVIAGKGDIYFERRADERNVVFINRYIGDEEMRDLFSRAATVVYPYISATQSGVISVASHFGKPIVVSRLPFFAEACPAPAQGVEFFEPGDGSALAAAVGRSLQSGATTRQLYDTVYSPQAMGAALEQIFEAAARHGQRQ